MSFQAIRKIRQAKRDSPNLDNYEVALGRNFNFNIEFSAPAKSKQRQQNKTKDTKDTDFKAETSRGPSRKSSLGMNSSRDKERKLPLMGNFLYEKKLYLGISISMD